MPSGAAARSSGTFLLAMGEYVTHPGAWRLVGTGGPGPFVTSATYGTADGRRVRWSSREHRKAAHGPRGGESVWWRPRSSQWWMAVLFAVGSTCFLVGGLVAQWARVARPELGVVFFVGSIFFTSASYMQYAEAVNAQRKLADPNERIRWRPASWEPRRIDWLATLVQFIGTLFFNVTTFTGMKHGFDTHQVNARVWAPDAAGSLAFLISSELAYAEVCHRWVCLRNRTLSWWIVALNMLGSIAFGFSAVASYVEPASGEALSAHLANGGTALGGLCFLLGSLLLMPEAARAVASQQRSTVATAAGTPAA